MIAQGAEAKLYKVDNTVVKTRVEKTYRIAELDRKLRKTRTRSEAKIIKTLPPEINRPELIKIDDKAMEVVMSYIDGSKVRDILEDNIELCREIGAGLGIIHNSGIIHGDLTTSNMIFNNKLYFIDFGLSFFSNKTEDKAVDLHLMKQALESKHYTVWETAFKLVLEGYKTTSDNYEEIIKRFWKVEARGRHKAK